MVDLRYDLIGAGYAGEQRHPMEVMKALRIHYIHATPQSMGDQWWFWCCERMTLDELPPYIQPMKLGNAFEYVGWGLSKEVAKMIEDYRQT